VTPAIAEAIGMKNAKGCLVTELEPDSPATKGGVDIGDVIVSINGEVVKDTREFGRKIASIAPGTSASLGLFRNGQRKIVTLSLGTQPQRAEAKTAEQWASEPLVLGLILAPANAVAGAGDRGVLITGVDPNGPAAESGLQPGDVILNVGRAVVNAPADVLKFVNEARAQSKHSILMRVKRADATTFVVIPIG
jgi:serine protease Do